MEKQRVIMYALSGFSSVKVARTLRKGLKSIVLSLLLPLVEFVPVSESYPPHSLSVFRIETWEFLGPYGFLLA